MQYDSNYMTFWERQYYKDSKKNKNKNQWLPGTCGEGRISRARRSFRANYFVKYCNGRYTTSYICQNPQSCSKMSPNVNYELQLIIMQQYQLINYKKCAILMQDVNNRGNCIQVEGVGRLPMQFSCKPVSSLKIKPMKKELVDKISNTKM